jgi:hypothetical protein
VLRLASLWSPQLFNERDLYVYLPRGYGESGQRYPVLYMQDGQNLFDDALSFAGEWHLDEALENDPALPPCIVVGIPNTGPRRLDEYTPFMDAKHGGGDGERYLDFLVETVKPLIDADFDTLPDPENTGIGGSSLGGLISLYGFFARPGTFGFAAVMSPSIWFADRTSRRCAGSGTRPRPTAGSTSTSAPPRGARPSPTRAASSARSSAWATSRGATCSTSRRPARSITSRRGVRASPAAYRSCCAIPSPACAPRAVTR